jgi:sodium/bile acid cotransporter 7
MALAALAAWLAPGIARRGGTLRLELIQPWLVAGIFLISGLSLPTRALGLAAGRWRAHLLIQGVSLAFAPLLAVALDRLGAFNGLDPGLRIGVIALACLPTTITSGVAFTRASGGDEALALFNATLGSLLGVVLSPALVLALAGLHADIDRRAVLLDLALQTALPMAVGQAARLLIARLCDAWRPRLAVASNLLLLTMLWYVFSTTVASGALSGHQVPVALLVVAPAYATLFAAILWSSGWAWSGLDRPGRIAAVITASQKSAALGVPLLTVLAAQRGDLGLLCLPIVLYHVLQLSVAGALASSWQRWAARG